MNNSNNFFADDCFLKPLTYQKDSKHPGTIYSNWDFIQSVRSIWKQRAERGAPCLLSGEIHANASLSVAMPVDRIYCSEQQPSSPNSCHAKTLLSSVGYTQTLRSHIGAWMQNIPQSKGHLSPRGGGGKDALGCLSKGTTVLLQSYSLHAEHFTNLALL